MKLNKLLTIDRAISHARARTHTHTHTLILFIENGTQENIENNDRVFIATLLVAGINLNEKLVIITFNVFILFATFSYKTIVLKYTLPFNLFFK